MLIVRTHEQWLFYSTHVHYKKLDGLTTKEHEEIFSQVCELILIDPANLLPWHYYLLSGDF